MEWFEKLPPVTQAAIVTGFILFLTSIINFISALITKRIEVIGKMNEWRNSQKYLFIQELLEKLSYYDRYLSMDRVVVREWAEKLYEDIKDLLPDKSQYIPSVVNGFYSPINNKMSEVHSYIVTKIVTANIWIDDVGRFAYLMKNIADNMRWYINQCLSENNEISKELMLKLSYMQQKETLTASELELFISATVSHLRSGEDHQKNFVEFSALMYDLNNFLKQELTGQKFREFKRKK